MVSKNVGIAKQGSAGRHAPLSVSRALTPPAFAETANYLQETKASEAAYLAVPGHNLLRGMIDAADFKQYILKLFPTIILCPNS